jgi:hypothetical protein
MFKLHLSLLACGVAMSFGGAAEAQTVDNPTYLVWSNWKEGASVTLKSETSVAGKSVSTTRMTFTLKTFSAEKAVVEIASEIDLQGQTMKLPPDSSEYAAKAPEVKSDPKFNTTKGREKLTINGKNFDCEWTEVEIKKGQTFKSWSSDDMPGGLVKMVSTDEATKSSSVMVVLDWKGTRK